MTHDDLLNKFYDAFPFAKVDDYRPVCHELFEDGKVGITIWLKNGDMVVYYPKEESEELLQALNIGHCKDCKYFERYHEIKKVPHILARNVCCRWGDKCFTKENGYCYLFEPRESEEVCDE